ncbi:hypothetical protein [Fulvivirga ligni]|uniref:hypothetical protein n=1 Tax=Fulvivirga ligni TaxID=2904246 RepID=UPI001F27EF66|nr:hypothetical protein [Fulvivirga ligni]UII21470.1 hypothetical protein LVD16_26945 [Fulvivirga ligni]
MKYLSLICLCFLSLSVMAQSADDFAESMNYTLKIKQPGNDAQAIQLKAYGGQLQGANLPLTLQYKSEPVNGNQQLTITVKAKEDTYFNLNGKYLAQGLNYDNSYLYLPGFWYRKNLRSPDNAPSARLSHNWLVREDRVSSPWVGVYDNDKKQSYSLARVDEIKEHSLAPLAHGEVVLSGPSDLGAIGFGEENGTPYLEFAYPYAEAPHSYFRKLTMGEPVTSFLFLKKGEEVKLTYQLSTFNAENYADYVAKAWTACFDLFKPEPVADNKLTDDEIKTTLTEFFKQSYVTSDELKGFSGIHLQTHLCEKLPFLEVGFIGRVLLNAFNALEYAEAKGDNELKEIAQATLDSYEKYGFADNGFFKETADINKHTAADVYSIRRQSEGIYAILFYLDYERKNGRKHPEYEQHIKKLLAKTLELQKEDGSFPRKFKGDLSLVDETGGSSPSSVLPLVMAYRYFKDKTYLNAARKVVGYLETAIISKSDYFSSTLDADCEDKEASLYAATALYYMAMVTKGKEQKHYTELAKQVAYFTLSWYYTWDVPFAQGQMLGDLGLKSRGWGNVSVENNHIDVFIFEFDEVLNWLADETGEKRFDDFAAVIKSSMREQLLPYEGHMSGIAKVGYYPEVVQHTEWDYGHFGKGFYNLHFAPGWTVASLWELLTVGRTEEYLKK